MPLRWPSGSRSEPAAIRSRTPSISARVPIGGSVSPARYGARRHDGPGGRLHVPDREPAHPRRRAAGRRHHDPVVVTRPWSTSTVSATISRRTSRPSVDAGAQGGYSATLIEVSGGIATSSSAGSPGATTPARRATRSSSTPATPTSCSRDAADRDSVYSSVVLSSAGPRGARLRPHRRRFRSISRRSRSSTEHPSSRTMRGAGAADRDLDDDGVSVAAAGIYISAQWNASSVTDAGTRTRMERGRSSPPHRDERAGPRRCRRRWPRGLRRGSELEHAEDGAVQGSFFPGYPAFRAQVATLPLLQGYEIVVPAPPGERYDLRERDLPQRG